MSYWPAGYWPEALAAVRDAGFLSAATITANTKRSPALASGKRGAPTTYLKDIEITPLDPLDPETRERLRLETPHELLQAFGDGGLDILEGDVLVANGREYPIRSAAQWAWRGSEFVHMVVEDLKR